MARPGPDIISLIALIESWIMLMQALLHLPTQTLSNLRLLRSSQQSFNHISKDTRYATTTNARKILWVRSHSVDIHILFAPKREIILEGSGVSFVIVPPNY